MKSIILHLTEQDVPFIPALKGLLSGRAKVYVNTKSSATLSEFLIKSKEVGATSVITTSLEVLRLLQPEAGKPKISEYAGSLITWKGIDFLIVDPLANLVTTNIGKPILRRFLQKILAPEDWILEPEFKWELFSPAREKILLDFFSSCFLISTDTETRIGDPERVIVCAGFSGIRFQNGQLQMMTVVVPLDDEYNLLFVRKVLAAKVPKVLQNGKYDIAYYFRYNAPMWGYSFDLINLFHSWEAEFPKDLGFISAYMIRNYIFHKNDGKTGDKIQYYEYNAKDCYTTIIACLALLVEIPEYAERNFLQEFPVVFSCILSEATGLKWNSEKAEKLSEKVEEKMEKVKSKLQVMVGCPTFNPNSPPQTVRLFHLLGSKDVTGSTPPEKDKVANRHPLNERIITSIVSYREAMKLNSSYFKEGVPWKGRLFYAINPHGTDTGRLASRESQFWCGLQIQNIPRDDEEENATNVKEVIESDEDFFLGEADYAQAEARDTAYLSGDTTLIKNVDDETKDFHGINASAFFGIPYEEIVKSWFDEAVDEWVHKTLNKPIRQLSKNTNHGANYNMGDQVLLDTMGIKKVLLAKQYLNLLSYWKPIQVTGHLLKIFAATYPILKGPYYEKIVNDVLTTGVLVGPTGWTRKCYGKPDRNKRDLNSYVAHPSQSLNAMTLNKAYVKVFQNIYLPNPKNFKLHAQIHDSILFSYRKGFEHLAYQVAKEMRIPIQVKDTFGITRELIVPVDLKGNATTWSELKPMKKLKLAA